VVYSDGNFTAYSTMYSFTSSPTTPEILSAFGDSISSIFLTVTPQPEVTSYTAVLSYTNYTTIKQLDVVENLTTTDETKQFIEITNLLQNVEYVISIYAINANGQSYLSNSITSTTIPTPDPPTNVTATFDTNANVSLSWIAPLNGIHLSIDSYLIQDDSGNTIETISRV
jgi:predicted phage tail protein